jgi:hypothetical protein
VFWERTRYGLSFYVKTTAAVLTFAATIAGAYFGFRSDPRSPTTAAWVSLANAVCDRDIGPVHLSFFDALLPSSDQASDQGASSGQVLAGRLRDMIALEGSLNKLNGDLATLPAPGDSRAPAVQAVISSGNALVDSMSTFSGVMQTTIDSNSSVPAGQIAALQKDGDVVLARELTWQKAIGALGLTRCPFWTAHPAATAPTRSPPAAPATPPATPVATPAGTAPVLTEGELELAQRLNSGDLTNCTGRPDLETGGIVAALNCQSVQAGPTKRPLVVQFTDVSSALTWFQNNTSGVVNDNDCVAGHERGTWDHNGILAGPWACDFASGDLEMIWASDSALVGFVADGSDVQALYSWWTSWGDALSS